jgi:hypothetical protein
VVGAERSLISSAFARLDPIALGAAVGVVSGVGLCAMTIVLLLRGGIWVGMNLSRLNNYLIGYDVTWVGSVVGLVEGAVVGFLLGAGLALLWNLYHRLFISIVVARERRRDLRRALQEIL